MAENQCTFDNPQFAAMLKNNAKNLEAKYTQNLKNYERNTGHANPLAKMASTTCENHEHQVQKEISDAASRNDTK
ncbi:hypothetical protein MSPP1_002745 [Malassezia sp. CBS 17886]|nr:hypothetical protein MSPP1_002745 [Malassezia sp. CBS 17886]